MRPYNDYTMTRAMGSVYSEWKYMVRLAIKLREGKIKSSEISKLKQTFTGIYKRLLDDPIESLYKELGWRRTSEQKE